MLPLVDPKASLQKPYLDYLDALRQEGFEGDIETSYASRLAVATDNSVYQKLPQAVLLPKHLDDLQLIGRLAELHPVVRFSARGGGTGTNGQSLTDGIIVDLSQHMRAILEFNAEERWVRVQAGVIKDQLNDFLRPHGFFFSPDLSTSNRATIGGMINTDASGQGSLVYGKTSDHVLALRSVLADGSLLDTAPMALDQARTMADEQSPVGRVIKQVLDSCEQKREQILAKFPRLNRFLTGYDMEHVFSEDMQQFDLGRVITGSEGSLAFVAEAKLNVTPIAKFKALINVKYDSFESALRHAPAMVAARATSVETVDSKVLNLAREDIVWHSVKELIEDVPGKDMQGLNMVEYNAEAPEDMDDKIEALKHLLDSAIKDGRSGVIGYQLTFDTGAINRIYAMRKKAVGLLGKTKGSKKPVAFAEDTAVPPEKLADFIMEFRALLDAKGLHYGMFGHVDAGVLHVRPALDLCDPEQESLMQEISDDVVALVAKYGGLMWGEHGKGYRSEYGPAFFGDELFTELRKIKAAFDPHNKMNPGKICTPYESDESLVRVGDTKRGYYDRQIPVAVRDAFEPAMSCNGNGLCFNYDATSPMCPSSKITGDRRHSPKGRAGLMREWLRLLSQQNIDVNDLEKASGASWLAKWRNSLSRSNTDDFSHQVMDAMDGCLACKACASQCPVNVDVPSFRARFLNIYYQRYARPFKDHLVANVEKMAPLLAKAPRFVNAAMSLPPVTAALKHWVGYVDAPKLSVPTLPELIEDKSALAFDLASLQALDKKARENTVLIVQDPFTSFYEAKVVADLVQLIKLLGYQPMVLPFKPNGKPQHVKGFLDKFAQTAKDAAQFFNLLAAMDIPLVGVDPSLVLCYRDEYNKALGKERGDFHVLLVHEWLQKVTLPTLSGKKQPSFALFGHCTEKTALPNSQKQWQDIFAAMGLSLETPSVGCCGMAGTYGHEHSHAEHSKGLFELSWQPKLQGILPQQVLATGYSCRSQVDRFKGYKPRHPLQALKTLIEEQ
ncbi:FAD-binding and (Fe-S)-binding domain-containing protein [Aliiglaciecola sp. CAU 1673]|uniref:D-2-hydroxyglutarate dehydrogenase YdiJ n=1 Tax=Aliiglaciecola sp. CAU 1673 TaxID=3032595 RepID=UPI0023DB01E6|nr:FAD-binding and (Fe-S)-binding domain-containing protein [Aliiglaciecola sp. CAU 1673]MDF2177727.1 FAD-binding and (Fe-S)-binding domain-containing protein [Aliiglaciecola sp. CAU 1673]